MRQISFWKAFHWKKSKPSWTQFNGLSAPTLKTIQFLILILDWQVKMLELVMTKWLMAHFNIWNVVLPISSREKEIVAFCVRTCFIETKMVKSSQEKKARPSRDPCSFDGENTRTEVRILAASTVFTRLVHRPLFPSDTAYFYLIFGVRHPIDFAIKENSIVIINTWLTIALAIYIARVKI